MIKRFIVEEDGYRIKRYLVKHGIFDNIFKEIRRGNGQYLVNDQIVDNHFLLKKGDLLEVVMPASFPGDNIVSIMGDLDIVYEDSYILILNKPSNMATIPTKEHFTDSLANRVMSYYKRNGILANIHFVSRLDAPTAGLIMLAKNGYVTTLLQETNITKRYLLETSNIVEPANGTIELGILKEPDSVIKRYTTTDFINSKTIYETIDTTSNHSIIKATLCTGKTHQLRIHFLSKNAPLVGDALYGDAPKDSTLHLFSYHLEFVHPVTNELLIFERFPDWLDESYLSKLK